MDFVLQLVEKQILKLEENIVSLAQSFDDTTL